MKYTKENKKKRRKNHDKTRSQTYSPVLFKETLNKPCICNSCQNTYGLKNTLFKLTLTSHKNGHKLACDISKQVFLFTPHFSHLKSVELIVASCFYSS